MDELSMDSLLSVAITIETNGAEYYRAAADISPPEIRDELLHLAEVEDEHIKKFELLKDDLTSGDKDPVHLELTGQREKYLHCIINKSAFIVPGNAPRLTGKETLHDVLKKAIDDEKDTIVFYQCLHNAVKDDELLATLGFIIDEELSHVFDLTNRLETL